MSMLKLRYYLFDFDDNILKTDTKINIKVDSEFKDMSTSEYASLNPEDVVCHEKSFVEFYDNGPRGDTAFHLDATTALNRKQFSASFNDLISCIKDGHLFAIITARGHHPDTIKKWFYMFINHYLTDDEKKLMIKKLNKYCEIFGHDIPEDPILNYLNHCYFYPISNPELKLPKKPEDAKKLVVERIVNDIHEYNQTVSTMVNKIQIGFSDDNVSNIKKMTELFNELKDVYKPIRFYIFDTSRNIKIKHKIK